MSDLLSALMTVPWMSFWKKDCPALSYHWHWADNQGFRRQRHRGTSWALKSRSQDSKLKCLRNRFEMLFQFVWVDEDDPNLRA